MKKKVFRKWEGTNHRSPSPELSMEAEMKRLGTGTWPL